MARFNQPDQSNQITQGFVEFTPPPPVEEKQEKPSAAKGPIKWKKILLGCGVVLALAIAAFILLLVWVNQSVTQHYARQSEPRNLGKVIYTLRATAEDRQTRSLVLSLPDRPSTFRETMLLLHDIELIEVEGMRALAGASGERLPAKEYAWNRRSEIDDPLDVVIFTGPGSPSHLMKMMRSGDRKRDGILMTYNHKWFDEFANDGGVLVVWAGGEFPSRMSLGEIEQKWFDLTGQSVELVGKSAAEIFGKPPFHNISPE